MDGGISQWLIQVGGVLGVAVVALSWAVLNLYKQLGETTKALLAERQTRVDEAKNNAIEMLAQAEKVTNIALLMKEALETLEQSQILRERSRQLTPHRPLKPFDK